MRSTLLCQSSGVYVSLCLRSPPNHPVWQWWVVICCDPPVYEFFSNLHCSKNSRNLACSDQSTPQIYGKIYAKKGLDVLVEDGGPSFEWQFIPCLMKSRLYVQCRSSSFCWASKFDPCRFWLQICCQGPDDLLHVRGHKATTITPHGWTMRGFHVGYLGAIHWLFLDDMQGPR